MATATSRTTGARMTDTPTFTIDPGPGFWGPTEKPNEFAADVGLELAYGPAGETVASITLFAFEMELGTNSAHPTAIGMELTLGDLLVLRDTAQSIINAIAEDAA